MRKKRLAALCMAGMMILTSLTGGLPSGVNKVQAEEKAAGVDAQSDGETPDDELLITDETYKDIEDEYGTTDTTGDGAGQQESGPENTGNVSGTGQGSNWQNGPEQTGTGQSGISQNGTDQNSTSQNGTNRNVTFQSDAGQQDTVTTDQSGTAGVSANSLQPVMSDVTVQGIQIINADEALVVGFRGEYEAEVSLPESGLTLQWQVSSDGMNWTDIQGQTERWLTFDVTEEVFSNWYRLTATVDGDGTVYASESVRPVRAVCYIENTGEARAAGDVEGYDSLAAAFGTGETAANHTIPIVVLQDLQVSETITVGCPRTVASYTNTYILKGNSHTISATSAIAGNTMFHADGIGEGAIHGKSHIVLQNVTIQGYPQGEEPTDANQVSSIFQLDKTNTSITIQGNTTLLNPGKNLIELTNSGAAADVIKIQSSTTDGAEQNGCVGPVNMQGRIAMAGSAAEHIQVLGDTANFTSDSDVVIAAGAEYTNNVQVVEYTTDADPYELAYFRLDNPGDFWIAFSEEQRNEYSGPYYSFKKIKTGLSILSGRPDSIFVKSKCFDEWLPDYSGEYSPDEYNNGAYPNVIRGQSINTYFRTGGPVPTLAAAYARIRQLNNDEDPDLGADVVIEETQTLEGTFTIGGTFYNQKGKTTGDSEAKEIGFSWENSAEIQRYIAQDDEWEKDYTQFYFFYDTLIEVPEGTELTLEGVTVRGRRGNEKYGLLEDHIINSPLITSNGGNVVLDGAKLTENRNERANMIYYVYVAPGVPDNIIEFFPDMGCGGAIAVYSGNLTLQNGASITDCSVYRNSFTTEEEDPEVYGGGIFFTGNGTLTINASSVTGNKVTGDEIVDGAGICITGLNPKEESPAQTYPKLVLENGARIDGNSILNLKEWIADSTYNSRYCAGVGIAVMNGAECTVSEGASISWNTSSEAAYTKGGGLYVKDAKAAISASSVENNSVSGASSNYGGGIYVCGNSEVTLSNGIAVNGNTAYQGGGIHVMDSSKMTVSGAEVNGNTSTADGGGIWQDAKAEVSITGSEIKGNQADTGSGGGIFSSGGAISLSNTSIGIENSGSTVAEVVEGGGNAAGRHGGGVAFTGTVYQAVVMDSVSVAGNIAGGSGGGISVQSLQGNSDAKLELTGTTALKGNRAANGGGLGSEVAGWRFDAKWEDETDRRGDITTRDAVLPVNMTATPIEGNSASVSGGGLYANSNIEITGENVSISNNKAGEDGGGIFLDIADPTYNIDSGWGQSAQNSGQKKYSFDYQAAKVSLTSGQIAGNAASGKGGGICVADTLRGTVPKDEELFENIFKTAEVPFIGEPVTISLTNCDMQRNTANSQEKPSSGIYQGDAVRVEISGNLLIGNDQKIWQDKTESELMEPYCSDNGFAADGSDGVSPYTGAYLSVTGSLTVNGQAGADVLQTMYVDFPNYILKRVIARYEEGAGQPDDAEVAKYTADADKLSLAGLKVDKEEEKILLLTDERYVPFAFMKYGIKEDGEGNGTPLAGTVFEIYQTASDTPGDYVGADNDNGTWQLWKTAVSDKDGQVDFGGLLPGSYMLVETVSGLAYEKPAGQWKINVSEDKTITITEVEIGGEKPPAFEKKEEGGQITYSLPNYELESSEFGFIKKDSVTKEPIEGVQFKLEHLICENPDTAHTHNDTCWETVVSQLDGEEIFRSDEKGKVSFGKMIEGTYRLTEIQTNSGYMLPDAPLIFVFDAGTGEIAEQESEDSTFIFTENNGGYILENVKKTNGQDFVFRKTDESGNPLDGAEFLLMSHDSSDKNKLLNYDYFDWYDQTGVLTDPVGWFGVTQNIKGESRESFISGEDLEPGMVNLGFLEDGEYLLIEKAAPVGYETPVGQWEILVGEEYTGRYFERFGMEESSELEIISIAEGYEGVIYPPDFTETNGNYKLVNKSDGTALPFSFTKVRAEDTDSPLPGVEFALYQCTSTEEGHIHAELASDSTADAGCWTPILENGVAKTYISGEDGSVSLGALKPGDYMLVETKTAEGYRLPTGQWMLTVPEDLSEVTITAKAADGAELPPAFMIEQEDQPTGVIIPPEYKLPNRRETLLPIMGGRGGLYWTLAGGAVVALATVLYLSFSKKRNHIKAKIKIRRGKGKTE